MNLLYRINKKIPVIIISGRKLEKYFNWKSNWDNLPVNSRKDTIK